MERRQAFVTIEFGAIKHTRVVLRLWDCSLELYSFIIGHRSIHRCSQVQAFQWAADSRHDKMTSNDVLGMA